MKNALEEIADEVYEQLRARPAGFCACAQCRDDAITRALNKIRPRYISGSPIGSAVTRVALSQRQARAEMSVVMLEAMQVVRTNPRHLSGRGALRAG
ncbi:MAG: late competence development ComFB family protein [Cytophagaceae bacterium]|nr:late competence development ComFB family protein [Gemmatimonadaceae bacterium]